MNNFIARQLREITATVEAAGGRLIMAVVLGLVGALALLAGLAFLAVALFLKVAALAGAVYAALAVGGAFILVALIALIILRVKRPPKPVPATAQQKVAAAAAAETNAKRAEQRAALSANIDESLAPVLDALHQANRQPEELILRIGAELTKQTGGFGLIALAVASGFLAARQVNGDKMNGDKRRPN